MENDKILQVSPRPKYLHANSLISNVLTTLAVVYKCKAIVILNSRYFERVHWLTKKYCINKG